MKSRVEILDEKHERLRKEAFQLSMICRAQSNAKFIEALKLLKEINELE
jgi:hypothetical protein